MYSAVPISEFVEMVVRGLEHSGKILEKDLESIGKPPPEEGVYRLSSVQQVYHRAEQIISSSKNSLLIDIDPIPLERLKGP